MDAFYLFAARWGRLLRGLVEGDPVAWIVLGVVVFLAIGIPAFKAILARKQAADSEEE